MSSGKNPGNVIGGHKANINNPNTSEEAKEHSREVIQEIERTGYLEPSFSTEQATDESGKEINRVLGGYKATVHNPNIGEDAKERAKEELRKHDIDVE